MEDGEDIQELSERAREKKERRAQNKILKEVEPIGSPGPDLETPRGGRKNNKKGKGKVAATADFDIGTPVGNSKRKRGNGKSTSMTPSLIDDEDDERDTVSYCR